MRRCVFIDRDGVLNRAIVRNGLPYPPADLAEFELMPGAAQACEALRSAGYLLVVVTNQPDVARGSQLRDTVERLNETLASQIPVDDIRVCYHDGPDGCQCRKPRPGLLLDAARDLHIDLARSYMIGDRWKDIEAGARAGCTTVFLDWHYSEKQPAAPDYRADSIIAAAKWILDRENIERT
jgi:D-glycero-D-manno-heptose 1,7-bisphosphate phosphatase